jgi:hypothetical protein
MKSPVLFALSACFVLAAGLLRVHAGQGSQYCGGMMAGCLWTVCWPVGGTCPDNGPTFQAQSRTWEYYYVCVAGSQSCGVVTQVLSCVTSCYNVDANGDCIVPAVCVLPQTSGSCK